MDTSFRRSRQTLCCLRAQLAPSTTCPFFVYLNLAIIKQRDRIAVPQNGLPIRCLCDNDSFPVSTFYQVLLASVSSSRGNVSRCHAKGCVMRPNIATSCHRIGGHTVDMFPISVRYRLRTAHARSVAHVERTRYDLVLARDDASSARGCSSSVRRTLQQLVHPCLHGSVLDSQSRTSRVAHAVAPGNHRTSQLIDITRHRNNARPTAPRSRTQLLQ